MGAEGNVGRQCRDYDIAKMPLTLGSPQLPAR
jgi:hypothetical protein